MKKERNQWSIVDKSLKTLSTRLESPWIGNEIP